LVEGGPTDPAGNAVTEPRQITAVAANLAPSSAIDGGAPEAAPTSNAWPTYQGSATDPDGNVVRVEASIDGGDFTSAGISCSGCYSRAPIAGPVGWTWRAPGRLADGPHTIAFRSVDNAGAASPAVARSVTIDTVPPTATGLQATGGAAALTVTFSKPMLCSTLAPADFSALVAGRWATVSDIACSGDTSRSLTFTLDTPVPGGSEVILRAGGAGTDAAGNRLRGSIKAAATNQVPGLSLTDQGPDAAYSANPRPIYLGSATDPDGQVRRVEASLDGGPFMGGGIDCTGCGPSAGIGSTASWAYHGPRLADGPHTITLRAVDNAGAVSPEVSQTVVVDSSPPALKAVMAAPGSNVVSLVFTKPIACGSVDFGNFSVSLNGAPASIVLATCRGKADPVVDLALTQAPAAGDPVQVTLTHPLADEGGNRTRAPASLSAQADSLPSDLP
jgi:hypothetical protein